MKKILLLLTVICFSAGAFAQSHASTFGQQQIDQAKLNDIITQTCKSVLSVDYHWGYPYSLASGSQGYIDALVVRCDQEIINDAIKSAGVIFDDIHQSAFPSPKMRKSVHAVLNAAKASGFMQSSQDSDLTDYEMDLMPGSVTYVFYKD